jgi:hypothetical protein
MATASKLDHFFVFVICISNVLSLHWAECFQSIKFKIVLLVFKTLLFVSCICHKFWLISCVLLHSSCFALWYWKSVSDFLYRYFCSATFHTIHFLYRERQHFQFSRSLFVVSLNYHHNCYCYKLWFLSVIHQLHCFCWQINQESHQASKLIVSVQICGTSTARHSAFHSSVVAIVLFGITQKDSDLLQVLC